MYEIDARDLEELENRLSQISDAEDTVNEVMHSMGVEEVTRRVTDLLPVSSRDKKHAKFSKPFTHEAENLGFIFKTKGGAASNKTSWGYLVFPDEGRGPRNPVRQDFTGRGIDSATPKIVDELSKAIISRLQEEL